MRPARRGPMRPSASTAGLAARHDRRPSCVAPRPGHRSASRSSTTTRTCGWCHVIKKEVASFKTSEHHRPGVGCQDCHTKPGVFNYFIRNLQSADPHRRVHLGATTRRPHHHLRRRRELRAVSPQEPDREATSIVGNIRVNHKGLREAGFQCVTCHAEVAHGAAIPVGSRPHAVDHVDLRAVPQRRHPAAALLDLPRQRRARRAPRRSPSTVHMDQPANCRQCHTQQLLRQVPQRPHDAAPRRAGRSPTARWSCSEARRSAPRVTPTRTQSSASTATASRCRTRPAGLPRTRPPRRSDPALCSKCHGADSCVQCHGVVLPHPAAFIASHFVYAAREGAVCVKCHGNNDGGAASCYGGDCHTAGQSATLTSGSLAAAPGLRSWRGSGARQRSRSHMGPSRER